MQIISLGFANNYSAKNICAYAYCSAGCRESTSEAVYSGYSIIAENGKTVVVENEAGKGFVNVSQSGSLKIVKTSSDGKVEGFSFRVTSENGYDETFTTDKNGEIFIEDIRLGTYIISEIANGASSNYIMPAAKTANVTADATTVVEMHNVLRETPKTGDTRMPGLWLGL